MMKALWEHRNKITLIALIILAILFFKQCGQAEYERKKTSQNQKALKDSIEVISLSNGDLITQKATFIADEKELRELHQGLSEAYDLLEKEKSKPKFITITEIVYRDTGSVKNVVSKIGKDEYDLKFNYVGSEGIIQVNGRSVFKATVKHSKDTLGVFKLNIHPGKTYFDSISVNLKIVLGVKEDEDGVDRVFAKPDPFTNKIKIANIDAVQLEEFYKSKYEKKGKRFSVGPQVGLGVGIGSDGQIQIKPQIGVGIQWSLIKF